MTTTINDSRPSYALKHEISKASLSHSPRFLGFAVLKTSVSLAGRVSPSTRPQIDSVATADTCHTAITSEASSLQLDAKPAHQSTGGRRRQYCYCPAPDTGCTDKDSSLFGPRSGFQARCPFFLQRAARARQPPGRASDLEIRACGHVTPK